MLGSRVNQPGKELHPVNHRLPNVLELNDYFVVQFLQVNQ